MSSIDPNLRVFSIALLDGSSVELRFSWPALARVEAWLGGVPWYQWDFLSHIHLQAAIAGAMLYADQSITPERLAERLSPARITEYRAVTDALLSYATTGKTLTERLVEAEEKRKSGEAKAASRTTPTE